jgi:hypothetical protein
MSTVIVRTYGADAWRLRCSSYGNPRWRIATASGTFTTSTNSACAYEVENYFRSSRAPRFVVLTLNKRGFVIGIAPADGVA